VQQAPQAFLNKEMTMKIGNCQSFKALGAVLALACMILAGEAAAKASKYDFELTQVRSECAGTTRFNAYMSFKPAPNAKGYSVSSGNACQLRGATCGIGSTTCTVTCSGPGPCTFDLKQCQQGRGSPWVKVWVPSLYDAPTAAIAAPRTPCP
jgi:hypothetical protein